MILPRYVFLSLLFFLLLAINYFLSSSMMTLNHFEFDSKNGFNLLQIGCRHVYIVSLKCWFQKERYKFYNLCLKSVLKKGINVDLDLIKLQSATHCIMKNRRYQEIHGKIQITLFPPLTWVIYVLLFYQQHAHVMCKFRSTISLWHTSVNIILL